jgi:hypothetical protein
MASARTNDRKASVNVQPLDMSVGFPLSPYVMGGCGILTARFPSG